MTAAQQRAYVWPTHYLTKFAGDGGSILLGFKVNNDGSSDAQDVRISATVQAMAPELAKKLGVKPASYHNTVSVGALKANATVIPEQVEIGALTAFEASAVMSGQAWAVMQGAISWDDEFGKSLTYRWVSYTSIHAGQWVSDIIRDETEVAGNEPPQVAITAPMLPPVDTLMSDYAEQWDNVPGELRDMREGHESLSQAKSRLVPKLNEELARLKNEEALRNVSIPRRAEVERLLNVLARVGEA